MENCDRPNESPTCQYSERAAKEAVRQTFAIIGVDIDNPEKVEEFRQDLRFGRSMRQASEKATWAFVAVAGTACAYAIWDGIVSKIKSSIGG